MDRQSKWDDASLFIYLFIYLLKDKVRLGWDGGCWEGEENGWLGT